MPDGKGREILEIQDASLDATGVTPYSHQPHNNLLACILVFLISFILLFLGMDRRFTVYDEGLILTGAMRVAAGNIPHRDFYANYGPAQFYIVAGLFKLFGQSVLVERLFDLIVKAGLVAACFGWTAVYCRKSVAALTALVCGLWLIRITTFGSPTIPVILLSLIGSALIFPAFSTRISSWRIVTAGAVSGLAALFRYDAGFALFAAHICFIAIAAASRTTSLAKGFQQAISVLWRYVAGTAVIFLPAALMYLAVAPIHPFIHDIFLYPTKYYSHARNLPFPGIHLRTLESLAVYLPIIVIGILLYQLIAHRADLSATGNQSLKGFLILFGLLIPAFYGKGLVRVGVWSMFVAIAPSLIVLAVLFEHVSRHRTVLRAVVVATMAFSVTTATWAALKQARFLYVDHASVLAEVLSPPGPASIRDLTDWCSVSNPLHKGLCFLTDADHIKAINFITSHTSSKDRLFVGVSRHDKIFANDNLTYFATGRIPATRWHHFDPDLQSRADIQSEMIREIDSASVPYILLDSEFDSAHEPNDSDKSSGVTLLDDYIRKKYRQVEWFGTMSVWQRNPPQ